MRTIMMVIMLSACGNPDDLNDGTHLPPSRGTRFVSPSTPAVDSSVQTADTAAPFPDTTPIESPDSSTPPDSHDTHPDVKPPLPNCSNPQRFSRVDYCPDRSKALCYNVDGLRVIGCRYDEKTVCQYPCD